MKKVLILTITLFVTIFVVVILGNVITIGEKFTTVFGVPYFEYAFYLLLAGLFAYLVYYAILEPMRRIHNAPEFPVLAVEDKEEGVTDDAYRKRLVSFGEKICDNCYYLKPAQRNQHQAELKSELARLNTAQDIEQIKAFLDKEIKQRYKAVDGQILKYGSKVFIITAISSSSMIDTLATMGLNYRMISDIVRASGFRPKDIDVTDVEIPDVDASCVDYSQYVKNLNIPGVPLGPLADGFANAVMTIAIGYIAKDYLQKGSKELKGAKGRRVKLKAKMKALGQVPRLLMEVPEQIGSSGLSWAMKGFEKAYSKVTKNKNDEEVMSDMDDYGPSEDAPIEERPKKKGFFGFWK